MEFIFYVTKGQPFTFDLTELGYSASESVPVYDIWAKEKLDDAIGTITTSVPSHGVRLFRLGDNVPTAIGAVPAGKSRVDGSTRLFDLQGRPVATPARGIYINNGKKIVVE